MKQETCFQLCIPPDLFNLLKFVFFPFIYDLSPPEASKLLLFLNPLNACYNPIIIGKRHV